MKIPITSKDSIKEKVDCALVLAWNFFDEIKLTPVETADEVLKIALTKELKPTEWVEPEKISDNKKEDKTQASIQ